MKLISLSILSTIRSSYLPMECLSSQPMAHTYVRSPLKSQAHTPRSKKPFPIRIINPRGQPDSKKIIEHQKKKFKKF